MSGSLSVIAALLALFYNASHARIAFASFAAICALTATYRIWARERQQRIAAEEYLATPDLSIELGRCYRWTGGGGPFVLLETTVINRSVGAATVKHFTVTLMLVPISGQDVARQPTLECDLRHMLRVASQGSSVEAE